MDGRLFFELLRRRFVLNPVIGQLAAIGGQDLLGYQSFDIDGRNPFVQILGPYQSVRCQVAPMEQRNQVVLFNGAELSAVLGMTVPLSHQAFSGAAMRNRGHAPFALVNSGYQ